MPDVTHLDGRPRRTRAAAAIVSALALLMLPACAARAGRVLESREGLASWYGHAFHGRPTASGRTFDMHAMVAAHPTYPFGSVVRVTNLSNGRSVRLEIQDRGPAAGPRSAGVIIDVSYGAAQRLDFVTAGLTRVRVEVVRW